MKYILLLVATAVLLHHGATAQITLSVQDFPAAGDTLRTSVDNMPANINVLPQPGQHSWNFASLQSPLTRTTVVKLASEGNAAATFPSATLVTDAGVAGESYYRISNNQYQLVGFAGNDPIGLNFPVSARFSPPLTERRAPLSFFDVNQVSSGLVYPFSPDDLPVDIFAGLPISPDSIRVRVAITRTDVVDGWGQLIIPGGVYDVLREKRTEFRNTRIDAKVGAFGWQDITDLTIQLLNIPALVQQLGQDTLVSYYFHSNEAKETIAVVEMNATGTTVERVIYKSNNTISSTSSSNRAKPAIYAYPNPAIVNVRFEFVHLPRGKYKLRIFNILGQEVLQKQYAVNGSLTDKVDISSLKRGTYLYSLSDERGKVIGTKRLIVVRP